MDSAPRTRTVSPRFNLICRRGEIGQKERTEGTKILSPLAKGQNPIILHPLLHSLHPPSTSNDGTPVFSLPLQHQQLRRTESPSMSTFWSPANIFGRLTVEVSQLLLFSVAVSPTAPDTDGNPAIVSNYDIDNQQPSSSVPLSWDSHSYSTLFTSQRP
ncbi:hypothetical protein MLD38_035484 [Melastoma candidum]|uniref:Uncharacterized protein n=2 Tax=Melastoma candidum TaxID=119954 RepID=A0ACB9LGC4_9MYRT|nr:hypothetical protein MLD38_035483 [Melastoma candidum]KAI4310510.1 hypothetical protein MLD38_035484 [Melastoma candidum]